MHSALASLRTNILVPATIAGRLTGFAEKTIRRLGAEGRISVVRTPGCRPLYSLQEIIGLADMNRRDVAPEIRES